MPTLQLNHIFFSFLYYLLVTEMVTRDGHSGIPLGMWDALVDNMQVKYLTWDYISPIPYLTLYFFFAFFQLKTNEQYNLRIFDLWRSLEAAERWLLILKSLCHGHGDRNHILISMSYWDFGIVIVKLCVCHTVLPNYKNRLLKNFGI